MMDKDKNQSESSRQQRRWLSSQLLAPLAGWIHVEERRQRPAGGRCSLPEFAEKVDGQTDCGAPQDRLLLSNKKA